ncbi:MAG TPA: Rieske (2Fe-2S) protein [Mycobacteriales bacterium]|nr:Rieske (2Fe-2S) protein [Mycobacteriales bacterium]HWB67207.1 Rieske (2Fe-2S) protein [Mycobacteriales bacterium]
MTLDERLDEVIEEVERARLLDPAGNAVRAAGQRVLGNPRARDVLSGRPIGHALHPALTLVAGGSLLGATLLDVVGGRGGRDGARRLVAVGLLAALPTAASGWSDWLDTEEAESRVGLVHALSNGIALLAYTRSWRSRRRGRLGLPSSLAGAAALGAGGWLGGHLAFALGVGVDTTAFQTTATDWTDVAAAADIDDRLQQVDLEGVPLLVTRVDGHVVAVADRCTHRGAPLSDGTRDGDCVVCPWHASVFSLRDGRVRRGPATRSQASYEVRELDGRIQVRRNENRSLRRNPVGT